MCRSQQRRTLTHIYQINTNDAASQQISFRKPRIFFTAHLCSVQRFYWTLYQRANADVCHGNLERAVGTCCDLLLKPDLSAFLRILVNLTLAENGNIRIYPDKMRFIVAAKDILQDLKTWSPIAATPEQFAFLEEQIQTAEKEVQRQIAEVGAIAAAQPGEVGNDEVEGKADGVHVAGETKRGSSREEQSRDAA